METAAGVASFTEFKVVIFRRQIVAGTNYLMKVSSYRNVFFVGSVLFIFLLFCVAFILLLLSSSSFCVLCSMSLDCQFLNAPSVFSNVYFRSGYWR